MLQKLIIIILIIFSYMKVSYAQKDMKSQTIIVTAEEIPSDIEVQSHSQETILLKDSLYKNKSNVSEALRNIPGVSIFNQGGAGKVSKVFLRGTNSEHTLVLIDGIEVNDPMSPGRAFDFAHTDLNSIEKIEVIKGPQSVAYGSDALGGVINIITKQGSGPLKPVLKIEGGSYGKYKIGLGASGGNSDHRYSLSLSHKSVDGFSTANESDGNSEKDGYQNLDVTSKFNSKLFENLNSEVVVKYVDAKGQLDRNGGPGADDPNAEESVKQFFAKLQLTSYFLNENLESNFSINYSQTYRKNKNLPDLNSTLLEDDFFKGLQIKAQLHNKYSFSETSLLNFGLEYEIEIGETNKFLRTDAKSSGVFVRYKKQWEHYFAGVGLRHDQHSGNKVKSTTYQLNTGFNLNEVGSKISMSLATGFKSPSLFFLYDSQFGNPNLKPEKVTSWDLGLEQSFLNKNINMTLIYFENNFTNLVSFDPLTSRSVNLGKSRIRGAELGLKAKLNSMLSLNIGASRLFEIENKQNNEKLIRRSENNISATAVYKLINNLDISVGYRYVGSRDDFQAVTFNKVRAPSFDVVDLTLDYNFKDDNRFFVRFDNLLNRQYEEIDGFGTAGFSVYSGVSLSY